MWRVAAACSRSAASCGCPIGRRQRPSVRSALDLALGAVALRAGLLPAPLAAAPSPCVTAVLGARLGDRRRPGGAGRRSRSRPGGAGAQVVAGRRRSTSPAAQVFAADAPGRRAEPVVAHARHQRGLHRRRCSAWGMYIGSRRELLWTLRARAERAEAEQELRASQSRLEERSRIAREMHDVLAHRISQISMRAGRSATATTSPPTSCAKGVTVIRDAANQALDDLRGVLGVLRDGDGEPLDAPQPTYADLGELVDEARRVGPARRLRRRGPADLPGARRRRADALPDRAGGHHQRPQARPGAELSIDVHGSPEDGHRRRAAPTRSASARPAPPAPGSAWSGSPSGPPCAAAASSTARRRRRSCCAAGYRGRRDSRPGSCSSTTTRWCARRCG